MLLVGMLDSPYVRRVAIAGTILGVPFEHRSVSVFRHMDRFREINPLVKAPSLVADDGTVLMESQLILQHLEDVAGRSLRPREPATRIADLRATGLALVLMEKAIAIEYERKRPAESQHQPWIDRVEAQLATALGALEGIAIRDWRALPAQQTHGSPGASSASSCPTRWSPTTIPRCATMPRAARRRGPSSPGRSTARRRSRRA
jgi:glutathione S-transferase